MASFGLLIGWAEGPVQIMGSGHFDGASSAKAGRLVAANSGLAARYCRKRRRLSARTASLDMWFLPNSVFVLWRECSIPGARDLPEMHSASQRCEDQRLTSAFRFRLGVPRV